MRYTLALVFGTALVGCEDGPDKIFSPFEGDPKPQNGFQADPDVFVPGDEKGFGDSAAGDEVGRAQFCNEAEVTALVQEMVVAPIVPDVSVGLIPMWGADGKPLLADDLLGTREDGKFCNPTGIYSDAFTWGPTDEVIVFFDPETRLVDGLIAYEQYLGTMVGTYTDNGSQVEVVVKPRERLKIDGVELDIYASRLQAPTEPRSWLNPVNVTKLYKMVRETFFSASPADFPADLDCVAEQLCDLIYTGSNEAIAQDTFILLQDSGIQIRFSPEGTAYFVYLQPVRSAPFENGGTIAFGAPNTTTMDFDFQSQLRANCSLNLDDRLSWMDFENRCIVSGDERALDRVNYNVDTARDAVAVEFNGIDLHFLRNTQTAPLFKDGERPQPTDTLYSVAFSRTNPAAIDEFRPLTLGNQYKARLEQRLKDSIIASITPPEQHPFWNYSVTVPFTTDEPQRIGELLTDEGDSWIPQVIAEIEAAYAALGTAEKAMLDPRVLDHVYLIEPFVDSVLFSFSHGESESVGAFKGFRTTDDARWSIGYTSFTRNQTHYRLEAQYSLNYGAVTYVRVGRGDSEIDRLVAPATGPYFSAADMRTDPLVGLTAATIQVADFDRQLETLTLRIDEQVGDDYILEVSGYPLQDLSGYNRQIRGERYEFVPAHEMHLFGKETILVIWIREDGTVGKVENRQFKGEIELCAGLPIRYGDDVQQKLIAWEQTATENDYRDCEVVFNYSANGNVLDGIASISNRIEFVVVDGRAVTAAVWE
jgi:hypothetical protein